MLYGFTKRSVIVEKVYGEPLSRRKRGIPERRAEGRYPQDGGHHLSEEVSVPRVHKQADSDREIAVPVDDKELPRDVVRAGRRKLLSALEDLHSRQ